MSIGPGNRYVVTSSPSLTTRHRTTQDASGCAFAVGQPMATCVAADFSSSLSSCPRSSSPVFLSSIIDMSAMAMPSVCTGQMYAVSPTVCTS